MSHGSEYSNLTTSWSNALASSNSMVSVKSKGFTSPFSITTRFVCCFASPIARLFLWSCLFLRLMRFPSNTAVPMIVLFLHAKLCFSVITSKGNRVFFFLYVCFWFLPSTLCGSLMFRMCQQNAKTQRHEGGAAQPLQT